MKIEIKHHWTGAVLFSTDAESLKDALDKAVTSGSNLRGCDLRGSSLSYSDLRGCDLRGCDLSYSNLSGSDLTVIRDDLWAVLSSAPKEVEGLRQALIDGHVNGGSYTGQCACLVGTIANNCNKKYNELDVLKPNSARPAERFFLAINTGDTPRNSQFSKLAVEWIDQWLAAMRSAFAA